MARFFPKDKFKEAMETAEWNFARTGETYIVIEREDGYEVITLSEFAEENKEEIDRRVAKKVKEVN